MTTTTIDSKKARQVIAAADLAISDEDLGNMHGAAAAARTAGRLAAHAGATLEQVWQSMVQKEIGSHSFTWNHIVDGWYDAAR